MSLRRLILNLSLRLGEKRFLARVENPAEVRDSFERKARWLFGPPKGTVVSRCAFGGVPCLSVVAADAGRDAVLLYFHGGAYVFGSARTHAGMLGRLSQLTGMAAILPDYRLAPEAAFPAAYEDGVAAYRGLLAEGWRADQIILGGDSAGGGLALALLGALAGEGLPQPHGTFVFSPFTDMTFSGASITGNAATEVLLPSGRLEEMRDMYLQGAAADDPRASPLLADFTGCGPVLVVVSSAEILEDDALRVAERMREQGVSVDVMREHGLPHVWPYFRRMLPEADRTLKKVAVWLRGRL